MDNGTLTKIVRPLRGGQITIPVEFRKRLGIDEHSLLQVTLVQGELHLKPVNVQPSGAGTPWLRELYELYAPARQEIVDMGATEEEVNADIDRAVAASRAARAPH